MLDVKNKKQGGDSKAFLELDQVNSSSRTHNRKGSSRNTNGSSPEYWFGTFDKIKGDTEDKWEDLKNTFKCIPSHFFRANMSRSLLGVVSSVEERKVILKKFQIHCNGTVNLICWRRSMLVLCFFVSILAFSVSISDSVYAWQAADTSFELAQSNTTTMFENENFTSYSTRMIQVTGARLLYPVCIIRIFLSWFIAFLIFYHVI